jgi:hypothetical protein
MGAPKHNNALRAASSMPDAGCRMALLSWAEGTGCENRRNVAALILRKSGRNLRRSAAGRGGGRDRRPEMAPSVRVLDACW